MHQPLSILAVTNAYPTAAKPSQGVFIEQQIVGLRDIGARVTVFKVNRTEQGMGVYLRMHKPLRALIAQERPDLLHVMYGGVMADRVSRRDWDCPVIVTFHGSDLLGENFSGLWRKWISRYGVLCSRRAARNADAIIVVSQNLKRSLPRDLDDSKVRIIPCGIDLSRFKPMDRVSCRRQLGWDPRQFHVLFVSNNNDPVKRPLLAASAVDHLKHANVSAAFQIAQAMPNTEMPIWMNASDVLLLTSAHEGSPTVVKEALACGLPVVSVDVGDVSERLAGVIGCHLARPEPEDLAAKLLLVKQAGTRAEARQQLAPLSTRNIAHQLEEFYHETLCRWKRSSAVEGKSSRVKPKITTRSMQPE